MTDDRSDARVPGESAGEATEEAGPGLQAQMRTARTEFEQHVAHARAEFEEANERIKKRTGRDLILAILIGVGIGAVALLSLRCGSCTLPGVIGCALAPTHVAAGFRCHQEHC